MPGYTRYFPDGLRHVIDDAEHNIDATAVHECDACIAYVKQLQRELADES